MAGDRVTSFFETVRLRDAQAVSEYYAEDGTLILANGTQVNGRQPILEFYAKLFSTTPPSPQIKNLIEQGNQIVAELGGSVNGQPILVVDHFTFDDQGLIESLVIYSRQPTPSEEINER